MELVITFLSHPNEEVRFIAAWTLGTLNFLVGLFPSN